VAYYPSFDDEGGYFVVIAQAPNLYKNSQQAIHYMIDHLASEYSMTHEQGLWPV